MMRYDECTDDQSQSRWWRKMGKEEGERWRLDGGRR